MTPQIADFRKLIQENTIGRKSCTKIWSVCATWLLNYLNEFSFLLSILHKRIYNSFWRVCEILCQLSWSNSETRMAAIVNFGPVEQAKASWRESFSVNSVDTRKNKNPLKSLLSSWMKEMNLNSWVWTKNTLKKHLKTKIRMDFHGKQSMEI